MGIKRIFKHPIDIYPVAYVLFMFTLQWLACIYLSTWQALIFAAISISFMCVPAALNHHHNHNPIFHSEILNRAIEIIFGLQTAISSYMWVIHHNLGHHPLYLDQKLDTSRWKDLKTGEVMKPLWYGFYNSFYNGLNELRRIGKQFPKLYRKYLVYRSLYYLMLIGFTLIFGLNFIIVFLIPSLVVVFYTIETTWYQHAGLEGDNHFHGSRNNISKFYNLRTCNLGYHSAHHVNPGCHWSLLPKLHEEIKNKIPPHLIHANMWHP